MDTSFQCNAQGQRTYIIYTYASCEYHELPTKEIQLPHSCMLILDVLPVTLHNSTVAVIMVLS